MKRVLHLLLVLLTVCSCATADGGRSLPYVAWHLGFVAPSNMEVWIETADVEDVGGWVLAGAGSDTASIGYSQNAQGGWPKQLGFGGGRYIIGRGLPQRIYVRWQSLVEPQTYRATLEITDEARQLMRTNAPALQDPTDLEYRNTLVIGLAPGGVAKVWVTGPVGAPIEVLCQQAEIDPKGPFQRGAEGRYVTLDAKSKQYLAAHAIPYDSWKCPKASR